MKKHRIWIYLGIFLAVNIGIYSYTLIRKAGDKEPQYGHRFPKMAAYDFAGKEVHWGRGWKLLLYFSDTGESGVENALYGDTLYKRYGGNGLTVIGFMPKDKAQIATFVRDSDISYPIVADEEGLWKGVLGTPKSNNGYAVVLVDSAGITRFATTYAHPRDLRLLVEKNFLGGVTYVPPEERASPRIGGYLPSLPIATVNGHSVQDLKDFRGAEIVFFTAQCPVCSLETYLDLYQRLLTKERQGRTIMVFSPQFAGVDVAGAAGRLGVNVPMFVAQRAFADVQDEYYSPDYRQDKVLLITTDMSGRISNVRLLKSDVKITETGAATGASLSVPRHTIAVQEFPAKTLLFNARRIIQQNGRYYALDSGNHRALVLNSAFQVERQVGVIGQGPGEVYYSSDLAVDSQGNIYLMDGRSGRLEMFAQEGTHFGRIQDISQHSPVAVNSKGEILIGQLRKETLISVYARDGKLVRSFGKPKRLSDFYGGNIASLDETYSKAINHINLTVDATDCVYVSFVGAPFFQKYDQKGNLLFEKETGNGKDIISRYQKDRRSPGTKTWAGEASIPIITTGIAISPITGDIFIASCWSHTSIYVTDSNGKGKAVLDPSPNGILENISLSQNGGLIMARERLSPDYGRGCLLSLPLELTIRR